MFQTPRSRSWSHLLDTGREDGRLQHEAYEGKREATLTPLPGELDPRLVTALESVGIGSLYSHQAEAFEAAFQGPTVVTTGTASGKSLCFNLPTLQTLLADPAARALYLYPTKALAQDQARALVSLGLDKLAPAIYDGDTPKPQRAEIRRKGRLILTNPDMLHIGVLPNHEAWADMFSNLAAVVIDEAHVYRGVFGSHVANVLRRLRRIAAAYGTNPRFLLSTATIANPLELAERLTGFENFNLVDNDGSPQAGRELALWNPPLLDDELGTRGSALSEAAEMLAELALQGARTVCFMKSRRGVELIAKMAKERVAAVRPELEDKIAAYRAGYTSEQRRKLEQQLTSGELLGIAATDALELGIDIGSLDAAICVTFPGTVASLRQMWGRAGRRRPGLGVYLAGEDALDQFFCRHPEEFLERPVEAAILDHESEQIFAGHLICAAHERPIEAADQEFFGPRLGAYAEQLEGAGMLRRRADRFFPAQRDRYPAGDISLRSSSPDTVVVLNASSGEVIGTVEAARANWTVHEGAVYLHQGRSFRVEQYDAAQRQALVKPHTADWYTQPKRDTNTWIERELDRRETLGVTLSFGYVSVTEQVVAFQRKKLSNQKVLGLEALDLPETEFTTQALWFTVRSSMLAGLQTDVAEEDEEPQDVKPVVAIERLLGALHAAEHAQIAVLPLLAMCDRWDIGGLSTNAHSQTGEATIFIYDGHPGGIGIARHGYMEFEQLVGDAHRLISECGCKAGCPSCVQSPKCGNLNEPLSKSGSMALLSLMLSTDSSS